MMLHGLSGLSGLYSAVTENEPSYSPPSAPTSGLNFYMEVGPQWTYQNSDGTGSTTLNDPVGYLHNEGSSGPLIQASAGRRPTLEYDGTKGCHCLVFDGVDDKLISSILPTYTVMDVMIAFDRNGTADFWPVATFRSYDANTRYLRVWSDNGLGYTENTTSALVDDLGSGSFHIIRGRNTDSGSNLNVWHHNNPTPGANSRTGQSKNNFDLCWYHFVERYSPLKIYAVAALTGSTFTTEQVNAIKSHWATRFGVTFAW